MDEGDPIEAKDDWEWKHPHIDAIEELREQIIDHEGSRRTRRLHDLTRTFEAWARFSRNFHALLLACETEEDVVAELIRNVGDRTQQKSIISALDQAIIAYGAGIGAVVDQTRNVLKLQSTDLRQAEAQRRRSHIDPIPGAAFLTKLRNYVLHYLAAPWEFSGEMQGGTLTARVMLSVHELDKFEWNAAARDYIRAQEDGIHLSGLLQPFQTAMTDHTNWILELCYKENFQLMEEVNSLVAKSNLLLTNGASDGRDWQSRIDHASENLQRKQRGEPQLDFQTGEPIAETS